MSRVISYGPQGIAAAWLVHAFFLDETTMQFEIDRPDVAAVEVQLGAAFENLATRTEVNQRIAMLGPPRPEPGTCAS
ncbi:MAG TPA: hypothetical protein VH561_03985 [Micromonosporaceae bacterium]